MVSGLSGLLALIASDTSFNASLGSTSGGVGVVSGLSGLLALIVQTLLSMLHLVRLQEELVWSLDSLDY